MKHKFYIYALSKIKDFHVRNNMKQKKIAGDIYETFTNLCVLVVLYLS